MSAAVRTGLSMIGPSPVAKRSFRPIGSTGSSRSAKMMAASTSRISTGCSVTVAARSGRLQISRMPCLARISRYCFMYRPACRMNHTGRTSVGRRRHASRKRLFIGATRMIVSGLSSQKNARSPSGLCLRRPGAAVDEERLGPRLAIERPRCDHRNRQHSLRRIAGARIHDVAVDLAFGAEELLVIAGSGHRFVLQVDFRHGLALVFRIANLDLPARLARRRAQRVNAAARGRNQRRP